MTQSCAVTHETHVPTLERGWYWQHVLRLVGLQSEWENASQRAAKLRQVSSSSYGTYVSSSSYDTHTQAAKLRPTPQQLPVLSV